MDVTSIVDSKKEELRRRLMYDKLSMNRFLLRLEENVKDELDLRKNYFELLDMLYCMLDNPLISPHILKWVKQIEEIISDELNHAKMLLKMVYTLSHIETLKD